MIRHILCDLGRVILMHDFERTADILARHSLYYSSDEIFKKIRKSLIYELFSKGSISKSDFYCELTRELKILLPYDEFIKVWNKVHTGINADFVKLIKNLHQQGYKFHLLSNIDEIHWEDAQELCAEVFEFFESFHLSFEMGMKKPNPLVFVKVLEDLDLEPEQCLFVDDLEENVQAAEYLGIKGLVYNRREHRIFVRQLNRKLNPA